MTRTPWFLGCVLALACNKPDDAKKAGASAGAASAGAASAGANPSAAGDAVAPVGAVTECPKSLGGTDKQHRVISKDCGVVQVTEDLAIEGGSLTLEAGASLAFVDGAGLTVGYYEPAKLIIQGTKEAPVVLTSAGDKAAGVWKGVHLRKHAARSRLEGLVIEYAGANDEAALMVEAGDVTLTGSAIRESKTGVVVNDGGFAAFTGNEFKKIGRAAAVEVPPAAVGGLGGGNRFDPGAFVQVRGGSVKKSANWTPVGAPLVIAEDVAIDGEAGQRATVEVTAGVEIKFSESGSLIIGYYENGSLVAKGSADAPITFTAQDKRQPGAWTGIRVHSHGELTLAHAVVEFGGRGEGGVIDVSGGTLALTATTLRNDARGVFTDAAAKITAFADNTFVSTPVAADLPANQIAALGDGNAYDKDAKILARGEPIKGKAQWRVQGAPIVLTAEIPVEGELTIDPGVGLLAGPDAGIVVGYYDTAALVVRGTAAAPVTIGPSDTARGTWPGIVLHDKATGNKLENLVLTGASNDKAIDVRGRANATLNAVTCSKCAGAVVGWECSAQVTSSQVLAADGTPKIDERPQGC